MRQGTLARAVTLDVGRGRDLRIGRAGLYNFLSLVLQGAIRFGVNWLVGRFAGAAALGAVAAVLAAAQVGSLLGPTTLGAAASRYVASNLGADRPDAARLMARRAWMYVLLMGTVIGVLIAIWVLWVERDFRIATIVLGMTCGLSCYAVVRGLHLGSGRMVRLVVLEAGVGVLSIAGVLGFLYADVNPVLLLTPLAFGYLLIFSLSFPFKSRDVLASAADGSVFKFVVIGSVGTIASTGIAQGAILIARSMFDAETAGRYAAAVALLGPLALVGASVTGALLPRLSRNFGAGNNAEHAYGVMVSGAYVLWIGGAAVISIAVMAEPIVTIVWGSEFGGTEDVFRILLVGVFAQLCAAPSMSGIASGGASGMVWSTSAALMGATVSVLVWATALSRDPSIAWVPWGVTAAGIVTSVLIRAMYLGMTTTSAMKDALYHMAAVGIVATVALTGTVLDSLPIGQRFVLVGLFVASWLTVFGYRARRMSRKGLGYA